MKIINRKEIDIDKWNELVLSYSDKFLLTASYLDLLCESWSIYVDDKYSKGMALPFKMKLGQRILYTPFFIRNIDILNIDFDENEKKELITFLHSNFDYIDINLNLQISEHAEKIVYQTLNPSQFVLGSMAKRILKKFDKSDLNVSVSIEQKEIVEVLEIIKYELSSKIDELNEAYILKLKMLLLKLAEDKKLFTLVCKNQDKVVGGMFYSIQESTMLYIKGSANKKEKDSGAMYAMMLQAINYADTKGMKVFDFGGSKVEGVRRFNCNLGGKDGFYFRYINDNTPIWFRTLRKLNHLIRKVK